VIPSNRPIDASLSRTRRRPRWPEAYRIRCRRSSRGASVSTCAVTVFICGGRIRCKARHCMGEGSLSTPAVPFTGFARQFGPDLEHPVNSAGRGPASARIGGRGSRAAVTRDVPGVSAHVTIRGFLLIRIGQCAVGLRPGSRRRGVCGVRHDALQRRSRRFQYGRHGRVGPTARQDPGGCGGRGSEGGCNTTAPKWRVHEHVAVVLPSAGS
jgi:hypothetical protein